MEQNIDKKADRIINSFKGSNRAKPSPALYDKIEAKIFLKEASMIPLRTVWLSVAAAILLIFINIAAISSRSANNRSSLSPAEMKESYSLISNYNIYE